MVISRDMGRQGLAVIGGRFHPIIDVQIEKVADVDHAMIRSVNSAIPKSDVSYDVYVEMSVYRDPSVHDVSSARVHLYLDERYLVKDVRNVTNSGLIIGHRGRIQYTIEIEAEGIEMLEH